MRTITLSTATLMLLGSLTVGMADTTETTVDVTAAQTQTQMQTQTKEMQQKHVQAMNQFKEQLAAMTPQERETAMAEMRTQMQTRAQEHKEAGQAMGDMTQTRAREHQENMGEQTSEAAKAMTQTMTQERSRTQEMTQSQQMQQMQNMQQNCEMQQNRQMQQDTMDYVSNNMDQNPTGYR